MEKRLQKQIRVIKKYAKAMNLDIEKAAHQWCESGLAARWAEFN